MQASCSLKAGLWPRPIVLVQRSAATWHCGLHSSSHALVTTVVSRVVLRRVRNCRSYYYYYILVLYAVSRNAPAPNTGLFYSCRYVNVNVIYLLSAIIKHYKAACTINELDSKAAMLHLQLPTNCKRKRIKPTRQLSI